MRFGIIAALALAYSSSAFGWGCDGHQMIALIARARLTPAISAEVDKLLGQNPIDPSLNRYCKDRPSDLMADSATWADDTRNIEKTAAWHFINIPIAVPASTPENTDLMRWCKDDEGKQGCIVTALESQVKILKDRSKTAPERTKALRYVIHLAGDITQPLHDSDNHDRGGNCASVSFAGQAKQTNLHTVWDTLMIAKELTDRNQTQQDYAAGLDAEFANRWPDWSAQKGDFTAWAWASHAIAVSVIYGNLKPPVPVAPLAAGPADQVACDADKAAVEAEHIWIGADYDAAAVPVIREQLTKAGYRLAALLNQALN